MLTDTIYPIALLLYMYISESRSSSGHDLEEIKAMQADISKDSSTPKAGSYWRHYKGGVYFVKGLTFDGKECEKSCLTWYSQNLRNA